MSRLDDLKKQMMDIAKEIAKLEDKPKDFRQDKNFTKLVETVKSLKSLEPMEIGTLTLHPWTEDEDIWDLQYSEIHLGSTNPKLQDILNENPIEVAQDDLSSEAKAYHKQFYKLTSTINTLWDKLGNVYDEDELNDAVKELL